MNASLLIVSNTLSTPDKLQDAMDIAYIESRKKVNATRSSWSAIRHKHV